MTSLCHRDKVVIKKTIRALDRNDQRLDDGLEDPLTIAYGASDVIYDAYRNSERRILDRAYRSSRAVRRGKSWNGLRYKIEKLATEYHLVPTPTLCPDGELR